MPSWDRLIYEHLRANRPSRRIDHFFAQVVAARIVAIGLSKPLPARGQALDDLMASAWAVAEAMESHCLQQSVVDQSEEMVELVGTITGELSHSERLSLASLLRGEDSTES